MKKNVTRILSFVLALAMVLSMAPAARAYGNVSSWAKKEVSAMDELGLLPDSMDSADLTAKITRLDMCRIAVASYEKLTGITIPAPSTHPFSDTTDPDVERAHSVGLINGREDGKFYPNDNLKRSEFFAFVSQFLETLDYPIGQEDYASLSQFDDAYSLPNWVVKPAQLCVGLGIVKGNGTSLDWSGYTSAEQAIAMFYRAYTVASSVESIPPSVETTPNSYPNLSGWAHDSVMEMDRMGLIPDSVKYSDMTGSITRGDMCTIAVLTYCRIRNIALDNLGSAGNPFSDTTNQYVGLAYKLGIVSGYTDGTFKPNNSITRQEYFKIAVNFLNAVGYAHTDAANVDLSVYRDSSMLANYAVPCARLLVSIGVIEGDNEKKLNPTVNIVCQEAMVIFMRIIQFMSDPDSPEDGTTQDPPSEDINQNPSASLQRQAVVDFAKQFLGYKYVYGGADPEIGFDCSGLVFYVYRQLGYTSVKRTSQWNVSDKVISKENLLPGDLVFFSDPENMTPAGIFHIAIYIGDNKILHAANANKGVIISSLNERYYTQRFLGGKRVIE